ncbi:MAG: hypothetical protein K8T25_04770 [Planctomycetia bacterium]|nr:hypothetical protein [Planctomycetia bacterium]
MKTKWMLLALLSLGGLGFAAAPSMADNYHHDGHHGDWHHGNGHQVVERCEPVRRVYYPPVPPTQVYSVPYNYPAPVVYQQPGIFYTGKHLSFGIGF